MLCIGRCCVCLCIMFVFLLLCGMCYACVCEPWERKNNPSRGASPSKIYECLQPWASTEQPSVSKRYGDISGGVYWGFSNRNFFSLLISSIEFNFQFLNSWCSILIAGSHRVQFNKWCSSKAWEVMAHPNGIYFALVCAQNIVFSASNNTRYTLYILLHSLLIKK